MWFSLNLHKKWTKIIFQTFFTPFLGYQKCLYFIFKIWKNWLIKVQIPISFWLGTETHFCPIHENPFVIAHILIKSLFQTALMSDLNHTPKQGLFPGLWYDLNSRNKYVHRKYVIYWAFKKIFNKVLEIYQITKADQVY